MHIISLANQKGGVGKTTTAVNLGAALAKLGKRVLIIDVDAQGNATSGVGISKATIKKDMYDVLVNETPFSAVIRHTTNKNLDIAPATIQLSAADIELTPMIARETRLQEAIRGISGQYDYVLIDCPPSLGLITINAFTASDALIIPVQSEYYALEGLSQLLHTIHLVQKHFNPKLFIEGVLMTMYDPRTNLGSDVVKEVKGHFNDKVYKTIITRSVKLAEAPSHQQSIIDYEPSSKGAKLYMNLAKEVLLANGEE